jgi:hypothetical protein
MRATQKRIDILLYSKAAKKALQERFKELNLNNKDVILDARENGNKTISMANLSVYFNYNRPMSGGLTHTNLLWLCVRYGINVHITIKKEPVFDNDKCLENLKTLFS